MTHNDKIIMTEQQQEGSTASLYERIGGRDGIARLIAPFYAEVQRHELLGPVFSERIADWPRHLAKITEFWAGMTGGPSLYPGGMGRHVSLPVQPEHFQNWLALWDANVKAMLPAQEAAEMSAIAHAIGDNLQNMMSRFNPEFVRQPDA